MTDPESKKALLLIGYQNDYFSDDGILQAVVEESVAANSVLENTLGLVDWALAREISVFATPIKFSDDYQELDRPVGILKTCMDVGAFRKSSPGSDTIDELKRYGDAIREVPGKTGLNAFSNTELLKLIEAEGVEEIIIAGVVTSVCIDSTARYAADKGFDVTVASDCTAGRSTFEQEYYCEQIFPIFATVKTSSEIIE